MRIIYLSANGEFGHHDLSANGAKYEPCAMCQGAVAWAGIKRMVFGSSIPFLKSLNWWAIDIRAEDLSRLAQFRECTVVGGILEEDCNKLFRTALNIK